MRVESSDSSAPGDVVAAHVLVYHGLRRWKRGRAALLRKTRPGRRSWGGRQPDRCILRYRRMITFEPIERMS